MSTPPPLLPHTFHVTTRVPLFAPLREQPALLLRELLWRWLCGGLLLLLAGFEGARIFAVTQPALRATGIPALSASSLLDDPSQLSTAFAASVAIVRPLIERAALGLAPLAIFSWVLAFGFGRAAVLARYDTRLPRRPWLLAACEGLRVGALLGASAIWGWLVEIASAITLRGENPNALLYGVLTLVATAAVLLLWRRVARAIEVCMAVALVDSSTLPVAFQQAWQIGHTAHAPSLRAVRKAAGRARLLLLLAAAAFTLLPAPFAAGWPLAAWWIALSLVLLAGADAVRLGVLFAVMHVLREPHLPGTSSLSSGLDREARR